MDFVVLVDKANDEDLLYLIKDDAVMEIRIRQMRNSDLQQLAEIYALVYQKFDIGEKWTVDAAKKLLSYWLHKQPDLAFVAECNKQVVGAFVAGIKPWWDGNHLFDGEIFVRPDYQKMGIGTELSKTLYKTALDKYKAVSFDAYTFKKARFPLNWYLSQGFVINEDWTLISGNVKTVLSKLQKK